MNHYSLAAVLLGAGYCSGFIDSIAGGGGLISLPALLLVGLPPHLALGTNKLAGTFGTFNASRTFIQKKLVRPILWRAAIIATLLGAVGGVLSSWLITAALLKKILPLILLFVAAYLAISKFRQPASLISNHAFKPPTTSSIALGLGLGFYDGFLGPGAGSFWTTAVMSLYKLDLLSASGIARCMNFTSNIVALVTFMVLQQVHYLLGLMMAAGIALGAYTGAHAAIYFGPRLIKPLFLLVMAVTMLQLLFKLY